LSQTNALIFSNVQALSGLLREQHTAHINVSIYGLKINNLLWFQAL